MKIIERIKISALLLVAAGSLFGIQHIIDLSNKKTNETGYQKLLSLPKSSNVLEVYYDGKTPILIDKSLFNASCNREIL